MSSHTGASALLALLTTPLAAETGRREMPELAGSGWELDLAGDVRALRLRIRNAIRRLLRAHRGRVYPAARAIGASSQGLRAAALAVGLDLKRYPRGRPRTRR